MTTPLRHPDPYDGPLTHGLDVSYAQPSVDWLKVAAAGHVFAYCKASEGDRDDHHFFAHYIGARRAGVVPGGYHFLHPEMSVSLQVSTFCDLLEHVHKKGDLPPVCDLERGLSGNRTTDQVLAFLTGVEARMGVRPVLYSGHTVAEYCNDARLTAFECWVPSYGHVTCQVPRPFAHWRLWQTSAQGRIAGIPRTVDLDVFRGDRAAFDAWRLSSGFLERTT